MKENKRKGKLVAFFHFQNKIHCLLAVKVEWKKLIFLYRGQMVRSEKCGFFVLCPGKGVNSFPIYLFTQFTTESVYHSELTTERANSSEIWPFVLNMTSLVIGRFDQCRLRLGPWAGLHIPVCFAKDPGNLSSISLL